MRTKKVKPPPKKYEYRLLVSKELDEVQNKDFIGFRLETTKEFLTFRYELKVKFDVIDNTIYINLLGFSAPVGDLSNFGVAGYAYRLYDFKPGIFNIVVERNDAEKISFQLKIQKGDKRNILVKNIPENSFLEIIIQ